MGLVPAQLAESPSHSCCSHADVQAWLSSLSRAGIALEQVLVLARTAGWVQKERVTARLGWLGGAGPQVNAGMG